MANRKLPLKYRRKSKRLTLLLQAYEKRIKTDASIKPLDSDRALVDLKGERVRTHAVIQQAALALLCQPAHRDIAATTNSR